MYVQRSTSLRVQREEILSWHCSPVWITDLIIDHKQGPCTDHSIWLTVAVFSMDIDTYIHTEYIHIYIHTYIHTDVHMYIDTVTTTLPPETALHGLLLDECASLQKTPPIGTRNNANGPISIRDFDLRHDTGFFIYQVWLWGMTEVISRSTERGEYRVWCCQVCKRTLLADFDSAVSELSFFLLMEWEFPPLHAQFLEIPKDSVRICSAFVGIRLEAEKLLGYSES